MWGKASKEDNDRFFSNQLENGPPKKVFCSWLVMKSLPKLSSKETITQGIWVRNTSNTVFWVSDTLFMLPLRQKQTIQQIGALFLLITAAVLLSIGEGSSKGSISSNPDEILFYGIVPVLVASILSGLASALCQWASQVSRRSLYLQLEPNIHLLRSFSLSIFFFLFFLNCRLRNGHRTWWLWKCL